LTADALHEAVSPHWLRHAHGSHALDRGATLSEVQTTLGHANVATTSGYLHARPDTSSGLKLDEGIFSVEEGRLPGTTPEALMEHRVDGQTAEDEHGDEGDYPRPPRELLSCAKPDCEDYARARRGIARQTRADER